MPTYTSFDVTILHDNHKLFSQEIRTLEGGEFDYTLKICKTTVFAQIALLRISFDYKYLLQIFAVPSKVLDLQSMLSANTQLTLIWRPPYEPNGEIVRYEVILKVLKLYADKKLITY